MRKYSGQKAFTMAEMVIAVSLVTLLAAMLIPIVVNNTDESKFLHITKNSAAELSLAYATFLKTNIADTNTIPWDIVHNMNYVRKIENNSLSVKYNDTTTQCSFNKPCLLLQNGALLLFDKDATFGNPPPDSTSNTQFAINTGCWLCDRPSGTNPHPNINALRFILDPDADGPENGVMLVLFFGGRVTTWTMAREAKFTEVNPIYTVTPAPNSTAIILPPKDPQYVWLWINN